MDQTHLAPVPQGDRSIGNSHDDHGSRRTSNANRSSYETGESSTTGSLRDETSNGHLRLSSDISPGGTYYGGSVSQLPSKEVRSRRKGRQASSNTFLLHDAVATVQDRSNHRQSRNMPQPRSKAIPQTPKQSRLSRQSAKAASLSPDDIPRSDGRASYESHDDIAQRINSRGSRESTSDQATSSPSEPQNIDVDSTQIVNMALNLSESRRIASTRRNVSRTHPPGLAPLPDISQGGSLRQHLQQQRKNSRGGSPRPAQPNSPRIPYGTVRTSSPLQSGGFEASPETSYRWHFTPSTLARAQKAKEQLELMAQYRRLLEMVPPLTPGHGRHLTSPPSTPANGVRAVMFGSQRDSTPQGRPYNPLQYIRNRKVRARERKVIDGEGQGFSDVEMVRTWVDALAAKSSANSSTTTGTTATSRMPPFPGVAEDESHTSPESVAKAAARTRRPRVDWFFDPCDMIADAYWLEQDNHKHLIEDRQRRKIFPEAVETARPVSKQAEDTSASVTPYSIKTLDEVEHDLDATESQPTKTDTDLAQVRTRERAKQKLHDIKGFHHRHSSSLHGPQDVFRTRKASFSDLSESEGEGKVGAKVPHRARAGTLSSDPNDLLQKQMLEILAKEARENQAADVPETVIEQDEPTEGAWVDQSASSKAASRSHSRKNSTADAAEAHKRPSGGRRQSPRRHRLGQFSLDFGDRLRHYSTDDDSSAPVSPQLEKNEHAILSLGSTTLSPPWSRSGSPIRNRLLKTVTGNHDRHEKQDRREKHGKISDHTENVSADEVPEKHDRRDSLNEAVTPEDRTMLSDGRQISPERKMQHVSTHESHKGHRSTNSKQLREDQSMIRGIFKGPRLDTVLRGGVSKLGDMLWKKEGSGETPQEPESSDESESEVTRGRLRQTLSRQTSKRKEGRHQSKHFLDAMPQFNPIADSQRHARADSKSRRDSQLEATSRSHSRQSSRVDLLKPPTLEVRRRSPSASPDAHPSESEVSDAPSELQRTSKGVRVADRRLSSIMGLPQFAQAGRSDSQPWLQGGRRPSVPRTQLSKREIARMKTLVLSSGIKAMEISRRAQLKNSPLDANLATTEPSSIPWTDIAKLSPDPADLYTQVHAHCDLYPLAARHLSSTIQTSAQRWQSSVDRFTSSTAPTLHRRLGTLRSRVADDLSERTREAADLADETGRDLALTQPLKVKHVQDLVEKLMRRRRRRFRWTRRAMWLGVEWVLVGFMWYVWFVVTILRLFLGVGKGVWAGVRWLLWL